MSLPESLCNVLEVSRLKDAVAAVWSNWLVVIQM
jgi:hypothetical protein